MITLTESDFVPLDGFSLAWRWTQGGVGHNVTPAKGGAGSRTTSKKGYTYTKKFTKAGTFTYTYREPR